MSTNESGFVCSSAADEPSLKTSCKHSLATSMPSRSTPGAGSTAQEETSNHHQLWIKKWVNKKSFTFCNRFKAHYIDCFTASPLTQLKIIPSVLPSCNKNFICPHLPCNANHLLSYYHTIQLRWLLSLLCTYYVKGSLCEILSFSNQITFTVSNNSEYFRYQEGGKKTNTSQGFSALSTSKREKLYKGFSYLLEFPFPFPFTFPFFIASKIQLELDFYKLKPVMMLHMIVL